MHKRTPFCDVKLKILAFVSGCVVFVFIAFFLDVGLIFFEFDAAIEACRQQLCGTVAEYNLNAQSECSEQTSTDGPVFEEFIIPIKKKASQASVEEDDDEEHSHKHTKTTTDKKKSDWLRSVQLWNPNPPPTKEVKPQFYFILFYKKNRDLFCFVF